MLHLVLVVCWTFLAVRDSQIDKGVMWADLGVSEGLCAAVLCCLSGIQSEAIMSRPISAGWTRFKNLLRAVVLCLPPILGGILLTRGGNAWAEVTAMVVLIALTTAPTPTSVTAPKHTSVTVVKILFIVILVLKLIPRVIVTPIVVVVVAVVVVIIVTFGGGPILVVNIVLLPNQLVVIVQKPNQTNIHLG